MNSTKKPRVLVTTFGFVGARDILAPAVPRRRGGLAIPCCVYPKRSAKRVRLFARFPEAPLSAAEQVRVPAALAAIDRFAERFLPQHPLVDNDGERAGTYAVRVAYHADISLEQMVQSFRDDGFEVMFPAALPARPGPASPSVLAERSGAFAWPRVTPTSLDDAWALIEAHPPPHARFVVRERGASRSQLAAAERSLGRKLPGVLREALARHDGIAETCTRSGPFLAGASELAGERTRLDREWQEYVSLPSRDRAPEATRRLRTIDTSELFAIGHDQTGHVCFALDASRISPAAEHPVLCLDFESERFTARWPSLGSFIAWIACEARTEPRGASSARLLRLFPESETLGKRLRR